MLEGLKRFIRKKLITLEHQFFWTLDMRIRQERHSHMSYAEIEAEISRQHFKMFGRKLD